MTNSAAFSPDGNRVVSGGSDFLVRIWDIKEGQEVAPRPGHTLPLRSVGLSKDGRFVLTGGDDATMRLWDLAGSGTAGEPLSFAGHNGSVLSVALSADGKRALSGGRDGTVPILGGCEW